MGKLSRISFGLRIFWAAIAALSLVYFSGGPALASTPMLNPDFGKIPLHFEPNQGQIPEAVRYLARSQGLDFYVLPSGFYLKLGRGRAAKSATMRMALAGAAPDVEMSGLDKLQGESNYFAGSDPKNWHTGIPNYAKVLCRNVYPGINLIYYGNQAQLEFDFIVSPGSNPKKISMSLQGDGKIEIDSHGSLLVHTSTGIIKLAPPAAYQEIEGQRHSVQASYVRSHSGRIRFHLGKYDSSRTLIIDPTLGCSTFLGGSGNDIGYSVAADDAGNMYVTGSTESVDFPMASPFDNSWGGVCGYGIACSDVFVSKLNAAGTALVYSTYLGGVGVDVGRHIAVDGAGSAFITGVTNATDFPVTPGAFQRIPAGGNDAFVTKLSPSGSSLVYSTYLGGSLDDEAMSVSLDSSGNAYIAGTTKSSDFRTTASAYKVALNGAMDAFVTKLNPDGSTLVYSTYLGGRMAFVVGSDFDQALDIAVDASGAAYVAGFTNASDFPTTSGVFQTAGGGFFNTGFVAKLNAAGAGLVYSTYLGNGLTEIYAIAVDSSGNAYVAGKTTLSSFATPGAYQTSNGFTSDGFVAKLNPAASALVYATYLGGGLSDEIRGISVDESGNAWITGITSSNDFPVSGAIQSYFGGVSDAFVSQFNASGSSLLSSTYFGGSAYDGGQGIAIGPSSKVYFSGVTGSSNFPTTANAFSRAFKGVSSDAFVACINAGGVTTNTYPLYFPRLVSTNGNPGSFDSSEYTGIAVVNFDTAAATVKFTAYDSGGSLISGAGITNPVTFSINPRNQLVMMDSQMFGAGITEKTGWIKAESSTPKITGFFLAFNGSLTMIDGTDVSGRTMSSFVFSEIESSSASGFTQMNIANPNDAAAKLDFSVIRSGQIYTPLSFSLDVPKNGVTNFKINIQPSDYIKVASNQPVAPLEFLGKKSESVQYFKSVNGLDVFQGAATLYAPQYAVGGDWRSNLNVINLSSTDTGTVTYKYYNDNGTQIGAPQQKTLAPLEKHYITDQDFFVNSSVSPSQGYVEISSNGIPLAGNMSFGDEDGEVLATALPLVSKLQTSMVIGQLASGGIYYTGLAILNPNILSALITIQPFDKNGLPLANPNIVNLPGKARIVNMLTGFFPGLSEAEISSGYILITASQGVAAFAVYGTKSGTMLTAVPTQAIP